MSKKSLLLVITFLLSLLCPGFTAFAQSDNGGWSQPQNLSTKVEMAWFPDITTDSEGKAHLVYLASDLIALKNSDIAGKYDNVYYQPVSTSGQPQEGPFNIAVSPYGVVPRAALTTDNKRGMLYLLFRSKGSLFFQRAPIASATSPIAWSAPRNIDDFGTSYYSALVVDRQGTIHAIWSEVKGKDLSDMRQVVMYRQSSDLGASWTYPRIIGQPKYGATRLVLKLDEAGGLHVSWDDGYDNQTARYNAALGSYIHSFDGGKNWSQPLTFGSEKEPIAQTTMTPFGDKGVMLVWRVLNKQVISYAVSTDRGNTWSAPDSIPKQFARRFGAEHFFDRYDLAADGKGRVHLVNVALTGSGEVGKIETGQDLAVYHNVWDNGKWREPELIGVTPGFAEYPRLAIGPDRLHVIWFSRSKPLDEDARSVWYSSEVFDTGIASQPLGKYTPPAVTSGASNSVAATPTPLPILPPALDSPARAWLEDGYITGALSLAPVLLIIAIITGIFVKRRRRSAYHDK